jgi:hypothetical protein
MATVRSIYQALNKHVNALQKEFIAQFIPTKPEHTPKIFQHQVKAYCVLAHAAFEDFVEAISLKVMSESMEVWLNKRVCSDSLLALCAYHGVRIECVEDENLPQQRVFDLLRVALKQAKKKHSDTLSNNHGFSLQYLRTILTPVGVNIPDDANLANSLRMLADARGSYAHTIAQLAEYTDRTKAKKPLVPENARDIVSDCLALCEQIMLSAEMILKPKKLRKIAATAKPAAVRPQIPG